MFGAEKPPVAGGNEEEKIKKPEFVPLPKPKAPGEIDGEKQREEEKLRKKLEIKKSGFEEGDYNEISKTCTEAMLEYFPKETPVSGAVFNISDIVKISDDEARVVGVGSLSQSIGFTEGALGTWEMKVIKDGDGWRVEKAVEVDQLEELKKIAKENKEKKKLNPKESAPIFNPENFSEEEIKSLEDELNKDIDLSGHPKLKLKVKSIEKYPDDSGVFSVNALYMEDGEEVLAGNKYSVKQTEGGWTILEKHKVMIDD